MTRKTIATAIIILAYIFPFRYAFLEGVEMKNINGNWVEDHPMFYVVNFLLVVAATMYFIYAMNDDREHKTRMEKLSNIPNEFIRPSPSSNHLGGVAKQTRETILLCEAAGFDVIIVETVGVGQSEVKVESMVDFFLSLMLPNAGDELQGIKKGVLELADAIVVNKTDIIMENALLAKKTYETALQIIHPHTQGWKTPVLTCSALKNINIDQIWQTILDYNEMMITSGKLKEKRIKQDISWMWNLIEEGLKDKFLHNAQIKKEIEKYERLIRNQKVTPTSASNDILSLI